MSNIREIPDVMRALRQPAAVPVLEYVDLQCYNLVVGPARVQLSAAVIPCTVVVIQADTANLGVVNIGGQSVSILNGLQLDPGRACLFSTDQSLDAGRLIATRLGHGVTGYQAFMPGEQPGRPGKIKVLNLARIYAVATLPNQNVRVVYISYTVTP